MITKLDLETLKHAEENRQSSVGLLARTLETLGLQPETIDLDDPLEERAQCLSCRSDMSELIESVTELVNCAFEHAIEERDLRMKLRHRQRELRETLNAEI